MSTVSSATRARYLPLVGLIVAGCVAGFSAIVLQPAAADAVSARDILDTVPSGRDSNARLPSRMSTDAVQVPPLPAPPAVPHIDTVVPQGQSGSASGTTTGSLHIDLSGVTQGTIPTSQFGPFIKCVLLSGVGWPIPTYSTECPINNPPPEEPPPGRALLTIVKETMGGDALFGFTVTGPNPGTTTVTTSDGTGSIHLILDPGTTTLTEDTLDGWIQTDRTCTLSGNTTGTTSDTMGWQFDLEENAHVTCTFINIATTTATTTPEDGQGGSGDSSSSGGGGSSGRSSGGGGNNNNDGEVLGESTSVPGMPNTGAGGDAVATLVTLFLSFCGVAGALGGLYLVAGARSVRQLAG